MLTLEKHWKITSQHPRLPHLMNNLHHYRMNSYSITACCHPNRTRLHHIAWLNVSFGTESHNSDKHLSFLPFLLFDPLLPKLYSTAGLQNKSNSSPHSWDIVHECYWHDQIHRKWTKRQVPQKHERRHFSFGRCCCHYYRAFLGRRLAIDPRYGPQLRPALSCIAVLESWERPPLATFLYTSHCSRCCSSLLRLLFLCDVPPSPPVRERRCS